MKNSLLKTVQVSREYTIAVAEAMPEKDFHSKPVKDIWDFNEQVNHIAYGIEWWCDNFIENKETEWNAPTPLKNKNATIAYLVAAFDKLEALLSHSDLSPKAKSGVHATLNHVTHHRGLAVIYLRHMGIAPPEYKY